MAYFEGRITESQGFDVSKDERKLKASFTDLKPEGNIVWGEWSEDGWLKGRYGNVHLDLSIQQDDSIGICIGCVGGSHHGTIYLYGEAPTESEAKSLCERWLHDMP